jgi:hypothetical protein
MDGTIIIPHIIGMDILPITTTIGITIIMAIGTDIIQTTTIIIITTMVTGTKQMVTLKANR